MCIPFWPQSGSRSHLCQKAAGVWESAINSPSGIQGRRFLCIFSSQKYLSLFAGLNILWGHVVSNRVWRHWRWRLETVLARGGSAVMKKNNADSSLRTGLAMGLWKPCWRKWLTSCSKTKNTIQRTALNSSNLSPTKSRLVLRAVKHCWLALYMCYC